jgi:hypothetical protein
MQGAAPVAFRGAFGTWYGSGGCATVGRRFRNGWCSCEPFDGGLDLRRGGCGPRGAGVLSHAHNAESIAEIRAETGTEKRFLSEDDAIATHAQLLAEKRIGFFILTAGITIHLAGLVNKSPEGAVPMGLLATGIVVAGLAFTLVWTKVVGGNVRRQAREAARDGGADDLPGH